MQMEEAEKAVHRTHPIDVKRSAIYFYWTSAHLYGSSSATDPSGRTVDFELAQFQRSISYIETQPLTTIHRLIEKFVHMTLSAKMSSVFDLRIMLSLCRCGSSDGSKPRTRHLNSQMLSISIHLNFSLCRH